MPFKGKLIAGVGTALATLIFIGGVSYNSTRQTEKDREWVTHTHLVLEKLDGTLASVIDAETGQRGYIRTGKTPFLDPYNDALPLIQQNLKDVRELIADNP